MLRCHLPHCLSFTKEKGFTVGQAASAIVKKCEKYNEPKEIYFNLVFEIV